MGAGAQLPIEGAKEDASNGTSNFSNSESASVGYFLDAEGARTGKFVLPQ